ncbi:MAG: GNAT family N-acetyltransferase [Myxococcota bacterium]
MLADAIGLLELEADLVCTPDGDGQSVGVLCTGTAQALRIGSAVPSEIASALSAIAEPSPAPLDAHQPPPLLRACERVLTAAGWEVAPSVSLVYVIEPGAFASDIDTIGSDRSPPAQLRAANPGNWDPVEWEELLDGSLGPWTVVMHDGRVVSLCHTPVASHRRAAECGVWTDPAFRGRGYASATTAAWAALLRAPGRALFYSTGADNRSSQRVAERLGLRLVGHRWTLRRPDAPSPGAFHPLSRLSRTAQIGKP